MHDEMYPYTDEIPKRKARGLPLSALPEILIMTMHSLNFDSCIAHTSPEQWEPAFRYLYRPVRGVCWGPDRIATHLSRHRHHQLSCCQSRIFLNVRCLIIARFPVSELFRELYRFKGILRLGSERSFQNQFITI